MNSDSHFLVTSVYLALNVWSVRNPRTASTQEQKKKLVRVFRPLHNHLLHFESKHA